MFVDDQHGMRQGIKGLLADSEGQDVLPQEDPAAAADADADIATDDDHVDADAEGEKAHPRPRNAAVPITIPVPEGSMPSKVWERLQKGGSLLGDPEERMMAEGQDGNTPGSGLVKV